MSQTISVIYAMSCANPEKNKIFFLEVVMNAIPQMNWIQRNYKNKLTEMNLILNVTNVSSIDFDLPLYSKFALCFFMLLHQVGH